MIVFFDLLTNGEVCSDSHGIVEMKEYNGAVLSVASKLVKEGGEAFDIGANASAEEAADEVDSDVRQVINVVSAHKLNKMQLTKDEYKTFIKKYMKDLKEKLNALPDKEERIKKFQSQQEHIQKFVMDVLKGFNDYEFYITEESELGAGLIIPAKYDDGALAPTFYYIAAGLGQKKY